MLLFQSEDHVEESGSVKGKFLTPEQMWQLADVWYRDRADPTWRRRTAEEAESVFAEIGLTGDFWKLA